MTQETQILSHLKAMGTITQKEAIENYNIYRLSARIYNLKDRGNNIKTHIVSNNNKHFAKYELVNSNLD